MAERIKYPVGIHTFSEIINENYLYVDKTALVYELIDRYKYVFLSRPRRFGKSLLMSTLASYFKGKKELFKDLAIAKLEQDWESYPVFRFDLSGENFNHPSRLVSRISLCLDQISKEYSLVGTGNSISDRFTGMIKESVLKYGKKVVILIDEYDKPMLDCIHLPEVHNAIRDELRGFFSVIKASDENVKFSMLTGVTRFSMVSIFSGPNNFSDISMLPRFNAICGITESEFRKNFQNSIRDLSSELGYNEEETWQKFKEMYDGYHFAERGEYVYNPYSVLRAFNDERINSYWFGSASPSFLIRLIAGHNYPLDRLEGEKRTETALCDLDNVNSDLVVLLFQTGYLTIKGYDGHSRTYTLGFPNFEVYEGFWEALSLHFFKGYNGRSVFDLNKLLHDLNVGNVDGFMTSIQSLLADIPYMSERHADTPRRSEGHFRDMMAIAVKLLGFHVGCEIHSSAGRCDMQIMTQKYVYIFEFKINRSPEEALRQIYDKGYLTPFIADSRIKYLIGAEFSTDTNTLKSWRFEKIC